MSLPDTLASIGFSHPISIVEAGFDPIWFGVVIVILLETSAITPPVGINVYVIKGIARDVNLHTIFKGIFPFLAVLLIGLVILTIFPDIVLVLPRLL